MITPGLIDLILVAIALEFAGLSVWLWRAGRARLVAPLALFLGAGAFLFLALRLLLAGGAPAASSVALSVALVCHVGVLVLAARGWRK